MATENTHVRYVVKYNDRTYEHPLHSNKRYFIRNVADVVNVLEYCVFQDLKKVLYDRSELSYTFSVERLVDDMPDESFDKEWFKTKVLALLHQVVDDNIQRNKG